MGVLGVIVCEVLELEIAYLLAKDADVGGVTVLEDTRSIRLIEALEAGGRKDVRRIPYIRDFRREPPRPLEIVVRVFGMTLHRDKRALRQALVRAAGELRPYVAALMLGYGLCGGTLDSPDGTLGTDIPVFIPMDGDHPVDDCVGSLIGGREAYHEELLCEPGTFFMTPGWTNHWRTVLGGKRGTDADDWLKRIFRGYRRSLLVVTPAMEELQMRQNSEEFSARLGLRVESRPGTLAAMAAALTAAKAAARG